MTTSVRRYPSMLQASELVVPALRIGDLACVLHSTTSGDPDAHYTDALCGDTRVVSLSPLTLANGYKFHAATGMGHASNKGFVVNNRHALLRDKYGNLPVDSQGQVIVVPSPFDGHCWTHFDR